MLYSALMLMMSSAFLMLRLSPGGSFPKPLTAQEEREALIQKDPAYGRIICRCETVTEGEIRDAIRRPLGARSVDAVKRRVRAGMGRCQGGFCGPKVIRILSEELGIPETEVLKNEPGSRMITGKTREDA